MVRTSFTLLAVCAVLLLGVAYPTLSGQPSSATGAGHLTVQDELRTFTFSAIEEPDGTVTGQSQLNNRAAGVKIHMEIDCLLIINSNTASISGVVTQSNAPDVAVGYIGVFVVRDNGEGANSSSDQLSLVNFFPASVGVDCESALILGLLPITNGNVQVRPGS
jgi:hypothetical protein